jgi:hypothetical protein
MRLVVGSQKKKTKMDGNMRASFVISGSPSSPSVSFFKFLISLNRIGPQNVSCFLVSA